MNVERWERTMQAICKAILRLYSNVDTEDEDDLCAADEEVPSPENEDDLSPESEPEDDVDTWHRKIAAFDKESVEKLVKQQRKDPIRYYNRAIGNNGGTYERKMEVAKSVLDLVDGKEPILRNIPPKHHIYLLEDL